jgi:molybdopterin-guanine dinucleotide biosynthesis protein A
VSRRLKNNRRGALILAGGLGSRLGGIDKALLEFNGKPLLTLMVEKVSEITSRMVVSVGKKADLSSYQQILPVRVEFVKDKAERVGPLEGIRQGMKKLSRKQIEYAVVLACDLPFLNLKILEFLLNEAERLNAEALIPRWPSGYVEPLHAVYNPKAMWTAARKALASSERLIIDAVKKLNRTFYVDVEKLRKFDSKLETFTNINTWNDLEKALNRLNKKDLRLQKT